MKPDTKSCSSEQDEDDVGHDEVPIRMIVATGLESIAMRVMIAGNTQLLLSLSLEPTDSCPAEDRTHVHVRQC